MANWTFEQQAAIELRHANLLISAAAGSGKTAVLVERITRLVRQKEAEIHKMLIVTYTNAAASEMRGRIESALAKAIEEDEANAGYLNEQIKLLNRASIKTFHAFCLDVIRNHFQKIDCDPGFKMLGEPEKIILIRQAIEAVLEAHFEKAEPGFLDFVEAYSGNRSDEKLIDLVLQVYHFIQSQPHPNKWLSESLQPYMVPDHVMRKEWVDILRRNFVEKLEGAIEMLEHAMVLCSAPGGPDVYIPTFEADIRGLNRLLDDADDMHKFGEAVLAFKFDRIASIKKNEKDLYDPEIIEECKDVIRDKIVKKQVFDTIKKFFDYKSMDRFQGEIDEIGDRMTQLHQLTIDFSERFQALKKSRNLMDFNDLEHYAIAILEDESICEGLRKKFDYIFVDEYQDSSGIQEHIIKKIARVDNVFMVGDVKQSIYKFRLADPELFIEKYKRFTKLDALVKAGNLEPFSETIETINAHIMTMQGTKNIRIDLRKNFRTRGEILERINRVFLTIMSEKLGEIDYDADAMLYQGMVFKEAQMPTFEINILSKKKIEDDVDYIGSEVLPSGDSYDQYEIDDILEADEILRTEEFEANAIANAIKSRIGTSVYDPKTQLFKPCTYRDIVILLRSSKSWTPTFEQVFLEAGIPLFADSSTGYFDTLEIKMVMALLKIIDNPLQDLALMTVLRSPMVGINIEELVTIKAVTRDKTYFYLKCITFIDTESEAVFCSLKEKLTKFFDLYSDLCAKALYMPLDELVWSAMQKSGFYYYVSAMPGGVSRQANLKLLVDRASSLKSSRIVTLGHFIEFVDKMSSNSGDFGVASVISEEDNVVRMMSIHKSKGLEFPVVMIGGLGRKFNFMDAQGDLIQHKHLGMGLSAVDLTLRTKSKTLPQFVIRDQIRRETLSEEMRVLYVGLTRPVDQIVLFATVSDYNRKLKQWVRGVDPLSLLSANGFIDWIMPALFDVKGVTIKVQDPETLAIGALRTESIEVTQINNWKRLFEKADGIDAKNPIFAAIDARLSFERDTKELLIKPLKISVSEKKYEEMADDMGFKTPELYETPQFMRTGLPVTAAQIGTAMHTILEKIDINIRPEYQMLSNYVETLINKHFLTEVEAQHIDYNKIINYLTSDLAQRIRMAHAVYRETSFVLKMDDQYVQGIIDLYLEEPDGLVLVDYKTDRIGIEAIDRIADRYRGQLAIYEQALTRLTGKKVKEKAIYFLDNNTLYPM